MTEELEQKIDAMLKACGKAHHTYEIEELNGEKDSKWPEWYANFLLEQGINDLFEQELDTAELQASLLEAATEYGENREISWHTFYARFLIYDFT